MSNDPGYGTSNHNIRPAWNPLVQRLQGAACSQKGCALISVTIMVNADGNPMWWAEPAITRIEPKEKASRFMDLLVKSIDTEK